MKTIPMLNGAGATPAWVLSLALAAVSPTAATDPLKLIDPLIGTAAGGHVFPGASMPYSMAKAGPDTDGQNQGGFDAWAELIHGFSQMHDSGTGGSASLGNFPIFPIAGCPDDDVEKCKFDYRERAVGWYNDSIKASPGYFAIGLNNSIHAEMTVANHTALYKFTFPDTPAPPPKNYTNGEDTSGKDEENMPLSPLILLEMNDLQRTAENPSAYADPKTGRITGNSTFSPSFGVGTYELHFCADFHGAEVRDTGVDPKEVPAYTYTRFKAPANNKLLVRVGVSFMSTEQACSNAEKEIKDFNFDHTLAMAKKAWRDKLSVVNIKPGGVSKELEISFWSGIYRTMLSPQDYTGENPLWDSEEPYYDSLYCIWDSFRSIHPFLTLVDPQVQSEVMRTVLDVYRHTGYLPDCRMSLCKGHIQGGTNVDALVVEAYLKKLHDIDWDTAYTALIKDAEVQPDDWNQEGRGSLYSWKNLDYIAKDDCVGTGLCTRSISRNVEYAYNDWCIAQMAKDRGQMADYKKYTRRSRNWENLYREDAKSYIDGKDTGFTGFMQPRYLNGTWDYQDPIFCSPLLHPDKCFLDESGHETYETSTWTYNFYAPHDMARLIEKMGGEETFVKRLEFLHSSGLLDMGNEPSFLDVFLFHYARRPALSAEQSHRYIPSLFNTTIPGLPGNDDSGAMGSFIALCMMGLYPVHGQDIYLITPPFFEEVSIRNAITGKTAIIRNKNFDPTHKNIYIQGVKWDGKIYEKNYIKHDFFAKGGVLELELGEKESVWGTRVKDLPPSLPVDDPLVPEVE